MHKNPRLVPVPIDYEGVLCSGSNAPNEKCPQLQVIPRFILPDRRRCKHFDRNLRTTTQDDIDRALRHRCCLDMTADNAELPRKPHKGKKLEIVVEE